MCSSDCANYSGQECGRFQPVTGAASVVRIATAAALCIAGQPSCSNLQLGMDCATGFASPSSSIWPGIEITALTDLQHHLQGAGSPMLCRERCGTVSLSCPGLHLQLAIKCADIGHLAASVPNHKRWAYLLEEVSHASTLLPQEVPSSSWTYLMDKACHRQLRLLVNGSCVRHCCEVSWFMALAHLCRSSSSKGTGRRLQSCLSVL